MKKITLLFTAIILLISCSQSPEKIKEDINEKYLSQAQTFIQSNINESNKDQDVTIDSFDNLKIDSSYVLSSQLVERTKMKPLWNKYNKEKEYLDKLEEIDKSFGSQPDAITIASKDKCQAIKDSLHRWYNRAKMLPVKDTLGYGVWFLYDLKKSDGATLKERMYVIYFDKNHDINGDWN